jgi:phage I-like protein
MFIIELTRTKSVASALVTHLEAVKNAEIEAYMVQYLTIVFYAEVESKVAELIARVFELYADQRISAFLSKNHASIVKRVAKSELAALAGSFGDEVKVAFNDAIEEREVSDYSNIITARHHVGHGAGINITLSDLNKGIGSAEKILATLSGILLNVPQHP